MNADLLMQGAMNLFIGLLIIGVSIPLVRQRVKMNRWYGIRIPKSYSSEANWQKINEHGGRLMIYWSLPVVGISLGMIVAAFFTPKLSSHDLAWFIPLSLNPLFILGAVVQIVIWSRHLPTADTQA